MDEKTMDVVPSDDGAQIAPQSDPSSKGRGQDSPGEESTIEALSRKLDSLQGIVSALQSDKDRRIPAIEKQLKAQAEQLESYYKRRESGMSHEDAMKADILDQIVAERLSGNDRDISQPKAPAEPTNVTIEDYLSPLLKLSGLDDNDAGVIEIVRKERDPRKQIRAIAELAESRKQVQQTPPNPAAVLPSGGGQALEGETLESITAELNAELAKPATPQTRARIRELGKRQRELLPKQ